MKSIKFRAWEPMSEMGKPGNMSHNQGFCCFQILHPDGIVIMQSTGLTDKNGKDVYEGDFVTMHQFLYDGSEVESQIFGVVEYCEDSACFNLARIKNKFYEDYTGYKEFEGSSPIVYFYGLHEESWEVIGNIHENPELVQQSPNKEAR